MEHRKDGLTRSCSANDMFLVTGGLQCGNCLARTAPPPMPPRCADRASDGPCPLAAEEGGICWVHRIQRSA